jgi:molecular chaperone GrpE
MTSDRKERRWGRGPARLPDEEESPEIVSSAVAAEAASGVDTEQQTDDEPRAEQAESLSEFDPNEGSSGADEAHAPLEYSGAETSGPVFAELLATRAELKRVLATLDESQDRFARRQADFENFRKRTERERSETYNRAAAELVSKLLPVLDNLGRALLTEASVEATESDEFRHFLSGVDLIYKQLSGVLEALGVKPVPAVGEPFDPHVHEAVVTEETDDYETDIVMQEIVRGYRLGDKLLRPALVKVAIKKQGTVN